MASQRPSRREGSANYQSPSESVREACRSSWSVAALFRAACLFPRESCSASHAAASALHCTPPLPHAQRALCARAVTCVTWSCPGPRPADARYSRFWAAAGISCLRSIGNARILPAVSTGVAATLCRHPKAVCAVGTQRHGTPPVRAQRGIVAGSQANWHDETRRPASEKGFVFRLTYELISTTKLQCDPSTTRLPPRNSKS